MSALFSISSSAGSYPVHIDQGGLAKLLAGRQQDIVIADSYFASALPIHSGSVRSVLFFEASEAVKSLDFAPTLIEQIRRAGATRQSHLIAIGGGIIQDLTAFAASIYMRGASWSYVPTTILSMVDSCIGGKSSINVGPYKNLVGTFHPPKAVFVDPAFALTLPLDQQASGIIEAAKICFCRSPASFQAYLSSNPHPGMSTAALTLLVSQSLEAKKWFIEIDEFDRKERLLLNFGHTFGHAIESASHYGVSHGIAVGLGMLCALNFARQSSPGTDLYFGASMVSQLEEHIGMMLRSVPNLGHQLAALSLGDVLERFESDKKHKQEHYVLVLVETSGQVAVRDVPRTQETRQRIMNSIQNVVDSYI